MRAETTTTTAATPERAAPRRRGLIGNASWSALDFWAQQATALLVFVLVGNIVGPAAVGLVTVAQLAVTLLMTLLLDGFSDALIQRRGRGATWGFHSSDTAVVDGLISKLQAEYDLQPY